ncbi:MAG: 4Fe-4S dicluster domain-containing protein [Solirubrobacterales bacterium]|nr:4Fe-4S dicluster domain-containing protein [Solirubrobacterales bacterium]
MLAALLAASGTLFALRVRFLVALVRAAAPVSRTGDRERRAHNEATIVLGQRKLLQRIGPGLIHAFIFWGFIVLGPTIVIAMIGAVSKHATFPWLGDQGWYALLVDIFAVLVLVGVVSALSIRKLVRPRRFEGSHLGEADLILALIATIALSLLLWHATRIALGLAEWSRDWAPVSHLLSGLFARDLTTRVLERVFVWVHVITILGFLAYLPRSKHLHIASAAFNVWYGRTGPGGHLEPLRFDDPDVAEEDIRFGAGTAAQLTWKEVLDTYSCTECGRCQDACPAFSTGKRLSPKLVIMGLRDQVFADGATIVKDRDADLASLVPGAVPEDSVWDCVTCGACVQACPVSIEHVDHIVDLRRHLVMVESSFPPEAEPMLRDIERASNPWGKAQSERADWAAQLGVRVLEPGDPAPEYLYWVGCATSFDERARAAAVSTAKLLQRAGVDFAILGPREACTGDPARRIGNEYVFQAFAEQNVETLNEAGATKIIANCPHCFNTLGNEYPDFGGDYEVIHHSEVLARLVADGRLAPRRDAGLAITYHDSCYLARHNDVLGSPRELVAAVGTPVEMARRGRQTFCCGAGGAHMWMEERGTQINSARVREAADTGAGTLAVACPFCTVMLDDGVQGEGADLRVADVATLLVEAGAAE